MSKRTKKPKKINREKDEFLEQSAEVMMIALERLRAELENPDKSIPLNQLTSAINALYDGCGGGDDEDEGDGRIEVDINVV